ncbi:MAG: alkaline phosphatase family protein [Dehalococcoidia bacterium]|nr:alkaline phosphatase family protein [Dehalococcoidia bacterium]
MPAAVRLALVLLVTTLAAVVLLAPPEASPADAQAARPPRTPIEHFIVLMQQNHSFDNYFGSYPGADGVPRDTCVPIAPDRADSECVRPFRLGMSPARDLPHDAAAFRAQFRDGQMNGFVAAALQPGSTVHPTMGHYDGEDIPYYWNVADNFVLFDRFFQSSTGGSFANHMFWMAGTSAGLDAVPPRGVPANIPTIFDRLSQAGVSWKVYVEDYDPSVTYRTLASAPPNRRAQVSWVPLLAIDRFLDDPVLNGRIVDLSEYFADLERGSLPNVAYVVPASSSEHPPGSIAAGQSLVRNLVTTLMRSRYWETAAFAWTYDSAGGWYDHVAPPEVDRDGYGFRVPALLVSAYAREGVVDHTELDFTSFLRFIEENWDLQPLATRDARANSIREALDFTVPPRSPVFLSSTRRETVTRSSYLPTYLLYGGAVVAAGVLTALSLRRATRVEPASA